jgi:hypothetical protein
VDRCWFWPVRARGRPSGEVEEVGPSHKGPRGGTAHSDETGTGQAEGEREMKDIFSRLFTLEVDGRPTLSFEASRTREAQEICKESWLRGDLIVLSSGGVPLCSDRSKFTVRPPTADEAIVYEKAATVAKPSDDMVLAYLIELDA